MNINIIYYLELIKELFITKLNNITVVMNNERIDNSVKPILILSLRDIEALMNKLTLSFTGEFSFSLASSMILSNEFFNKLIIFNALITKKETTYLNDKIFFNFYSFYKDSSSLYKIEENKTKFTKGFDFQIKLQEKGGLKQCQ